MSSNTKRIALFCDANTIELQSFKKLDCFSFNKTYYDTIEFLKELTIEKNVDICLSKITIDEITKHYKEEYDRQRKIAQNGIDSTAQCFGSLLSDNVQFKVKLSNREYDAYIKGQISDYIKDENIIVYDYPDAYANIIKRAIDKKTPFTPIKRDNKDYSDAGFKDVVLWETIISQEFREDDTIILFTKDKDFNEDVLKRELNGNKFYVCRTSDKLKELLVDEFIIDLRFVKIKKFINTSYFSNILANALLEKEFELNGKLYEIDSLGFNEKFISKEEKQLTFSKDDGYMIQGLLRLTAIIDKEVVGLDDVPFNYEINLANELISVDIPPYEKSEAKQRN